MRTRAQRRHKDFSKAKRKAKISAENFGFDYYDNLHQYSKNKIHCSCGLCRRKTNNKTHSHVWYPAMNWMMCDRRRIEAMADEQKDYEEGGAFVV